MQTNPQPHPWRFQEAGAALITTLAVLIPILVFGGVMITSLTSFQSRVQDVAGRNVAQTIAISSTHDVLSRLAVDPTFRGDYEFSTNGGRGLASAADANLDGLDNDGNGLVDDVAEDDLIVVRVDSLMNERLDAPSGLLTRTARTYASAIDVTLSKEGLDFGFAQTIYIDDPLAGINVSGGALTIAAADRNLDGTMEPVVPRPALGIGGPPDAILAQLTAAEIANFTPSGGADPIEEVAPIDIPALIAALRDMATMSWPDDAANPDLSPGAYGPPGPDGIHILHFSNDAKINTNQEFSGIIVVEGDLEIGGSPTFNGLIVVGGNTGLSGGGSGVILNGGLLIGGQSDGLIRDKDNKENTKYLDYALDVSGSLNMYYSTEGLQAVTPSQVDLEVLSWIQH